jgi:hypothetical protein
MFPQSLQATTTRFLAFPPSLAPPILQSDASKARNYPSEHSDGQKSSFTTTSDEGSRISTDGCRSLGSLPLSPSVQKAILPHPTALSLLLLHLHRLRYPCEPPSEHAGRKWIMSSPLRASTALVNFSRTWREVFRTRSHRHTVAAFLKGQSKITMADIIPLIFN